MTTKQRIKREVFLEEDEEILIVKKKPRKSSFQRFCVRPFVVLGVIVGSLIALGPVLLRLHGDVILTKLLFQTWSRYYPWIDITKPHEFGLNGVNLYEQTETNVTVGLWYIVPSTVEIDQSLTTLGDHLKKYIESKDKPIIMYLHGQDGTRATNYRANHYRMMSSFGNHIVALDYRGYGDSTGVPSIHGIVHDVLHIFTTIRKVCPDNPITIWGHSMGTGVALWTLNHLFESHTNLTKPSGVVLEAPFYNTMQGLISYPLTRILKLNPYFIRAALDSLISVKLDFPNNEIISFLPLPIVIIHAEDDGIIPYFHAELIDDYVKTHRDKTLPPVRLITVPRTAGCGHNHIYLYQKFQEIVSDFSFLKHSPPE